MTARIPPSVFRLLLLSSLPCLGVTKTWDGTNGNWNDANKWSPAGLPASGDDVIIPAPGVTVFTLSLNQNASIRNYTQNGATYGATLRATAAQTLTLSGPLTWSGGAITGGMTVVANGGVTISAAAANRQLGDGGATAPTLVNNGTFNLNASLYVAGRSTSAGPHAQITNNGTFNFTGSAGLAGSISGNHRGIFQNNAGRTVNKTGNGAANLGITFNNLGSVNVSGGTLLIGEGTNPSGSSFSATGNGTLSIISNRTLGAGVTISGNGTVDFGSGSATVINGATYNVTGTTRMSGALDINSAISLNHLELTTSSARRGGSANLTIGGTFTWSAGTLVGAGETIVNANGVINLGGGSGKNLGGAAGVATKLINNGTANLNGSNFNIHRAGAEFRNNGTFNHTAQFTLVAGTNGGGALGKFTNEGQYIKEDNGTGRVNTVFDNRGTVTINRGRVNFWGAGTDVDGEYIVGSNGTLGFGGGTRTLNFRCSVSGAGDVVFSSGTTTFNSGDYGITGRTTIEGSAVAVFHTAEKATTRFLTMTGGTRSGNALLEASGAFTWNGGTLASGTSTTANGVLLGGASTKHLGTGGSGVGATFQNLGAGSMSGDSELVIAGTSSPTLAGSRFWNHGSIDSSGNMSITSESHGGNDGLFVNFPTGTFIKSGAGTTTGIGVLFQNAGSVSVTGGTLSFPGGFEQSGGQLVLGGGTVSGNLDINGGSLGGSGTIIGNTTNAATLAPGASAGFIDFNGNLTLESGSALSLEIGGTGRGTGHDAFDVSGTLILGGTLTVHLIEAYEPQPGDTFDLWNAGATSGAFTAVNLPALSGELSWDTSQLVSAGTLKISGEGGSFTYDDYAALYSLAQGPDGDDDGDGLSNLIEFILASHPKDRDSAPFLRLERSGTTTTITLDVPGTPYDNVSMWIESSVNLALGSWSVVTTRPAGGAWSGPVSLSAPVGGRQTLEIQITESDPARFYRFGGSYP